jgi:hypothetical protein
MAEKSSAIDEHAVRAKEEMASGSVHNGTISIRGHTLRHVAAPENIRAWRRILKVF